jgi:drug/metabolite transporter (DMT)-like permease
VRIIHYTENSVHQESLLKFKYHLLVLLATILVAGSFLASEKLSGVINPISLTLLRFTGAALLLFPVIFSKPKWRAGIIPALPRAMVISLFYSLFFIAFFESLNTTTSLKTGALFTLTPLITALLSIPLFKERISGKQTGVYLLGAAGACWVVFGGQLELLLSFSINRGDLIFLAGVLSMCGYSLSMKLLYRNDDMLVLAFCTLLGGAFWMMLALLITRQPLHWGLIQGPSIFHMSYLIIGSTLITVYLYQTTTATLGPSRVNAYIYLNPALVALLLFLLDETAIPMAIVPGILISFMATVILQCSSAKPIGQKEKAPSGIRAGP